jgi:hypothetical protein|tara:strand:- start:20 stop:286 length:267 start_codon:yes stop_codon:yes gene_type:complete
MTTMTKKQKVINALKSGKGITANQAKSRFGVGNLRATMSSIKNELEQYGNWEIVTEQTRSGQTRYMMNDTHPGTRKYGFDKFGNRYAL